MDRAVPDSGADDLCDYCGSHPATSIGGMLAQRHATIPANTRRLSNVEVMLARRLRRRASITSTLGKRLVDPVLSVIDLSAGPIPCPLSATYLPLEIKGP